MDDLEIKHKVDGLEIKHRLKRVLEKLDVPKKLTPESVFTYLLDTNQRIDALDSKIRRFSRLTNAHLQESLLIFHKLDKITKKTALSVDALSDRVMSK